MCSLESITCLDCRKVRKVSTRNCQCQGVGHLRSWNLLPSTDNGGEAVPDFILGFFNSDPTPESASDPAPDPASDSTSSGTTSSMRLVVETAGCLRASLGLDVYSINSMFFTSETSATSSALCFAISASPCGSCLSLPPLPSQRLHQGLRVQRSHRDAIYLHVHRQDYHLMSLKKTARHFVMCQQ